MFEVTMVVPLLYLITALVRYKTAKEVVIVIVIEKGKRVKALSTVLEN
jgi:hypothetical protein